MANEETGLSAQDREMARRAKSMAAEQSLLMRDAARGAAAQRGGAAALKTMLDQQRAIGAETNKTVKQTVNWQKALIGVGLVAAKVRSYFNGIVGESRRILMVNERLAAMAHITTAAVRQTSDAWLMVSRTLAHIYSILRVVPSWLMAGVMATGMLAAVAFALKVAWLGIAAAVTKATGGMNLLVAGIVVAVLAATSLFFYLSKARKESEYIKGVWTDITNLWKNAQAVAFAQPLPALRLGAEAMNVEVTYPPGMNWEPRDPRQAPVGQVDDGL